jgi:hypothetical protein
MATETKHQNGVSSSAGDPYEYNHTSVGQYIATRIPSLKPPMDRAPNPFKVLAMLNTQQWLFFLVAFIAWYEFQKPRK